MFVYLLEISYCIIIVIWGYSVWVFIYNIDFLLEVSCFDVIKL